jgi:hypothetical protein
MKTTVASKAVQRKRSGSTDSRPALEDPSHCTVEEGDEPAVIKARNGLRRDKVVDIYSRRPDKMGFKKSRRGTMVSCEAVALEFGVTPKTIRDIWRGRTWGEATGHPQSDAESRSRLRDSDYPVHPYTSSRARIGLGNRSVLAG